MLKGKRKKLSKKEKNIRKESCTKSRKRKEKKNNFGKSSTRSPGESFSYGAG